MLLGILTCFTFLYLMTVKTAQEESKFSAVSGRLSYLLSLNKNRNLLATVRLIVRKSLSPYVQVMCIKLQKFLQALMGGCVPHNSKNS